MEEVVGVSSAVLGDMASRPNFGLNELDFVFSTLVVGSILNFTLMYLLAPTLGSTSTTLPFIFANCPTSHMFEPGPFSVMNRLGTLVYKGTLFAAVGLGAGLAGTALSNGLIKMRKKMDPNFESPNKPPPMLLNAVTWAIHMGVSSNLRYQTLNGIEFLLAKAVPPVVFKSAVIGLRMANNVLGGMTFVMLARVTGSQSSGPEKKVNKVVDEENQERNKGGSATIATISMVVEWQMIGEIAFGWRSRVAADPQFAFKVLMEEVVGVSSAVLGDMASRPNFGLNELDFVFSTLVVGSILNFTLMYLLAPTLGSTSTTLPFIFANCPTSHMFEPGPFSVMNRLGTLVYKGTLFAAVGLGAGLAGTALSNGLIKMRKKMDPNFESPNKPPPMLLNAVTWAIHMGVSSNLRYQTLNGIEFLLAKAVPPAIHMGVSSNLRYQTLNGIEFLLAKAVPPVVFKSSVIGLRMANNVLGGMTFVMLARLTGSQSSGPEKKVNKVVDEENQERNKGSSATIATISMVVEWQMIGEIAL
ncbi:hypothetical protein CTI12_AA409540 [Artemisia annua]|uniref:Uncharacterized protein n=1 Tax=Artemisia annua TaxID=35608 RepID=A0A2U1M8R1_ARTAN|nr:hypothetical protein CTI12_AA409540 [Artemisia annua]